MPGYRVDSAQSRLIVRARSSIHDTLTTWKSISGDIAADPGTLDSAGATASFTVDMTAFDAGDWLKNRKLKNDLDLANHPRATFELKELRDVKRTTEGEFQATALGVLRWRGREVELTISGQGAMDADQVAATGTFDLDIRTLGVEPPRFLMFKVESEVTVEVTLRARAG